MPSQPLGTAWDFRPALDLIDSEWVEAGSPELFPTPDNDYVIVAKSEKVSSKTDNKTMTSLGDFSNIWKGLGVSTEGPVRVGSPIEPETESSNDWDEDPDYTPPGSVATVVDVVDQRPNVLPTVTEAAPNPPEEPDREEDPCASMTKRERRKAQKKARKARKADQSRQQESEESEGQPDNLPANAALAELPAPSDVLPKQPVTPFPSNVGAKIRPVSAKQYWTSQLSQERPCPFASALDLAREKQVTLRTGMPGSPAPAATETPLHQAEKSGLLPIKPNVGLDTPSAHLRGVEFSSVDGVTIKPSPATPLPAGTPSVGKPAGPTHLSNNSEHLQGSKATTGVHSVSLNLDTSLKVQYHAVGIPTPNRYSGQFTPSTRASLIKPAGFSTPTPAARAVPLVYPPPRSSALTRKQLKDAGARSREDRDFEFLKRLIERFPVDKKWLVSPMRLCNDKISAEGIHVFVDASNIQIGFNDKLRSLRAPPCDMPFDTLALLMERRRPVAKRVYAGSTREIDPITSNEKFTELAGAVGYEKIIYTQVYKAKELTDRQRFFKDVKKVGWPKATRMHSGLDRDGSDSETGATFTPATPMPVPTPKWVEQGVDEALHLKMLQSIVDCDVPSTMVLATGDGNEAEYSDGFLKHVERALKKGWSVELVSWRQGLSSGYKRKSFRAQWGDRFTIIELDDYVEFMVD